MLSILPPRLQEDFDALAQIGSTGDGGINRPTFSEAHLAARRWYRERVQQAGLEFFADGAGNHSAILPCAEPGAPTLLLGSHLDSVPYGGRFDGALGVLAALEVLRIVKEKRLRLPVNLEAIDFTDEEGTLFGLLGSSALAGKLTPQSLQEPRGGRQALSDGLQRAGLSEDGLLHSRRAPESLAGYLELHIEQGSRLEQSGVEIGVVTGIVGIVSFQLVFTGRANHAGTTPMNVRCDAAQGAAAFTLAVRELTLAEFPGCTANVGQLKLEPGAFNIIPGQAVVGLECRAADEAIFTRLETALLQRARVAADRFGLGLAITPLGKHLPAAMSQSTQEAIVQATDELGLQYTRLASGAGHDAQMLAELCPAGMIFVPSAGGVSHSPDEFTSWQDCLNGANVLLQAALRLARGF